MKKILQRIGLLAAAVMLLWGWQGMDAKAADEENYSFGFSCTGDQKDKIDVSKVNKSRYDAMCKESPLLRDICVEFEEWRDKWSDWKT